MTSRENLLSVWPLHYKNLIFKCHKLLQMAQNKRVIAGLQPLANMIVLIFRSIQLYTSSYVL